MSKSPTFAETIADWRERLLVSERAAVVASESHQRLATLSLRNLLSGIAKMHDAPMSSEAHLLTAVAALASATDWRPENEELAEILDDAVQFVALTPGFSGQKLASDAADSHGIMRPPDSAPAPE